MGITFAPLLDPVDRENQKAAFGSLGVQRVAVHPALYFQVYEENGLAHIDLRARAEGFF